jgi:hypothetical protein
LFTLDPQGSLIPPIITENLLSDIIKDRIKKAFLSPIDSDNINNVSNSSLINDEDDATDEIFMNKLASNYNKNNVPTKKIHETIFRNTSHLDIDSNLYRKCKSPCSKCNNKVHIGRRNREYFSEINKSVKNTIDNDVDNKINDDEDSQFAYLRTICSADPTEAFNSDVLSLIDGFPHDDSKYKFTGKTDFSDMYMPLDLFKACLMLQVSGKLGLKKGSNDIYLL